jgi:hypothetical protein
MCPIFLQDGEHGIGLGYEDFKQRFQAICEEHLQEKRATAFAFVFCDFEQGVTAEASGDMMTVFYLHLCAREAAAHSFNAHFLQALGVAEQVEPPCIVCFRVQDGAVEDVALHPIDERSGDPVLVLEQMRRQIKNYLSEMKKQGDLSALSVLRNLLPVARLFRSQP